MSGSDINSSAPHGACFQSRAPVHAGAGGLPGAAPLLLVVLLLLAGRPAPALAADDVYQKPSEFLREVFAGELPRAGLVTLTDADLTEIKRFMPHGYEGRKVRFWAEGDRSAWILDDIGKTRPITVGYVVKAGRIERTQVLVYRESHGHEVREKFFTRQFNGAGLDDEGKLDRRIDNIAGATLSVRALTRMAQLALYLEGKRQPK